MVNQHYTIETVLKGHPDKVCDQISDGILDEFLKNDSNTKAGIECLGVSNSLIIAGEIKSNAKVDVEKIASEIYKSIGYSDSLEIINKINVQSYQLNKIVEKGLAGDQGVMYGFACNKIEHNFLPFGVLAINDIARNIDDYRINKKLFLPDGKIQATIENNKIKSLIISLQHKENCDLDALENNIKDLILNDQFYKNSIEELIFDKSDFIQGGFMNDTGLTGRKIIIDTYCGLSQHGGGAFSGKDPSKMDRSASYMSRFVAKNIVANEMAENCTISVSYAFGKEEPVMIAVNTNNIFNKSLTNFVKNEFDFRPNAIIERLNLKNIEYLPTACYGHFSNENYEWEKIIVL
ncbi:methionine adenosyltransferase [Jejudonia soesokkakensis]|uniref:Methionine adenosyltransferase n=1 Tax=Jejudonia soesokkakensis TaxID=1323432 RepID=A0ABW2MQC4_9FLAO